MIECHCRLDKNHCCKAVKPDANALTAEALMRSRYCAFIEQDTDYLLKTWHPDYRPESIHWEHQPQWIKLEIVATRQGQANDSQGIVHFKAYYLDRQELHILEEISEFIKVENVWLYQCGEIIPSQAQKLSKNQTCPCGSGKKFKRCCAV